MTNVITSENLDQENWNRYRKAGKEYQFNAQQQSTGLEQKR